MSNTNINIKVSTGKRSFALEWSEIDKILYVETKSRPLKGEANNEILKKLRKLFKTETYLVSGLTSKEKIIRIELEQEKVFNILQHLQE